MEVISAAQKSILQILKRFRKMDDCGRLMKYCVQSFTDNNVLLFNLLTRELVLLSEDEHRHLNELDYLKDHWFVVPEQTKEQELADLVRWVLKSQKKKSGNITGYTIFTTTDCNARCFYCFEKGFSKRMPMSRDTALKVARYIKEHCADEPVRLAWFGGEPLFNPEVINIICNALRRERIEFRSTMVSNGYLFDEKIAHKAAHEWNLKHVQITLDGTETVYNRIKAYIYKEGSPYQVVMDNIQRLLDEKIPISIRLNMDLYNAENLLELIQELGKRFGGQKGISVYVHHLFDGIEPMAGLHSDEEWEKRDKAMIRLTDSIEACCLSSDRGITREIRLNHCKADSGNCITILPDGNIGLCDKYSDSEFIGHIDWEDFDMVTVESWKQTMLAEPECAECFYYPSCIRLKKCGTTRDCYRQRRQELLRNVQHAMQNEYEHWRTHISPEENDDDEAQC